MSLQEKLTRDAHAWRPACCIRLSLLLNFSRVTLCYMCDKYIAITDLADMLTRLFSLMKQCLSDELL